MTITFTIWLTTGAAIGAAHAWLLWKASQPPFTWAATVLLRYVSLAAIFIAAAVSGFLIPVVVGWTAGFPLNVARLAREKTT